MRRDDADNMRRFRYVLFYSILLRVPSLASLLVWGPLPPSFACQAWLCFVVGKLKESKATATSEIKYLVVVLVSSVARHAFCPASALPARGEVQKQRAIGRRRRRRTGAG